MVKKSANEASIAAVTATETADDICLDDASRIFGISVSAVARLIEKGDLQTRESSGDQLSRAQVLAYLTGMGKQQRQALDNIASLTEEYDF